MSQSTQAAGSGWPIYRRLLGYVRPYRVVFTLGAIAMVLHAISDAGVALQMQPLLDEGFGDGDRSAIPVVIAIIAGLVFLRAISGFVSSYSIGHVGRSVVRQLRAEILDRYLHLPVGFFDRSSTGVLISKLTYDAEQLADASSRAIIIMVSDTLKVIGLVAVMFVTSWKLSLVVIIVAPIIGLLINYVSGRFRRYSSRIQDSMGDLTRVTEESVVGQRVIKVFGGAGYERNRFSGANRSNFRQHMRLLATQAGSNAVVMLIAGAGIVTVVYIATSVLREQLTVGSFGTFFTAMIMTNAPLKRLSDVVAILQKGIAAGQSLFSVLDLPVEDTGGEYSVDRVRGKIEFRDVVFAYDTDKGHVLNGISFSLEEGQTLAVVGQSGSGKSTLVSLLPRFYDPDSGKVLLDGHELDEYKLEALRRQIGYVSQDITLFNDTIARNIAYGFQEGATSEQIRAAADAAHVTEFVEALPKGFDTLVGDRGVLLSGGQRQRIAIARALLKDAPVLILDEATSALDSASERKIQEALEELKTGRTTLVIAHRLSTVENADQIMVLDAGRVVEYGTHQELYARGGHYQALHKIQFQEARAAATN